MTEIPNQFKINFPNNLDDNNNLFLVHDSLKVTLSEDYNPSDNVIIVDGDISNFPENGIITLTEQYSSINDRTISFYYLEKIENGFKGLTPLSGFKDNVVKKKGLTFVTQNVMAEHHNAIKDSIIEIEKFIGIKNTTDSVPLGDTIEGRINYLNKLAFYPKAWFTSDKKIGLAPLEVEFFNESFKVGSGDITYTWTFGDASDVSLMSIISAISVVPISAIDVSVVDLDGGSIKKIYTKPGNYTVSLTVQNEYGSDTVEFENFINVRAEAPNKAIIDFDPLSDQIYTNGIRDLDGLTPVSNWITPPKIRSKINKFINLFVDTDSYYLNIEDNSLRNNNGALLDLSLNQIDPIDEYEWILFDDLSHSNENNTKASYSIGGIYDLILKVTTRYGSYRITKFPNAIDIVEDKNMFLFTIDDNSPKSFEFGLISETFKDANESEINLEFDDSFLDSTYDEDKAKLELRRNVGFTNLNNITSGYTGNSVIAYATGGSSTNVTLQKIKFLEFSGFNKTFTENPLEINRPWNWCFFPLETKAYFLFGTENSNPQTASSSLTYEYKDSISLGSEIVLDSGSSITSSNYINGANELSSNPYVNDGEPKWSVNRCTSKNNTGYLIRNDSVGTFFRLRHFYRTEGVTSEPILNLRKMQDIGGNTKTEGQLVALNSGVYFFNNSGNVSAFNVVDNKWESLSITPSVFKNFQDISVAGYDLKENTLIATSDGDRNAYISFDYTNSGLIKFNSIENTFTKLNPRPNGIQWFMGVY